jgi:hypothetical protein
LACVIPLPPNDCLSWRTVPVLYTEVPSGTTAKRFADQILYDLGYPLYGRGTTIEKTVRIRELFKRCRMQMLLVDEVNHFVDTERSPVAHDVADWLKTLIDQCTISVAILGIPRCLEVLRQNEQLRRRFSAPFTIGYLRWDLPHDRRNFKLFLRSVQEHLSDYEVPCLRHCHFNLSKGSLPAPVDTSCLGTSLLSLFQCRPYSPVQIKPGIPAGKEAQICTTGCENRASLGLKPMATPMGVQTIVLKTSSASTLAPVAGPSRAA